MLLNSAFGRTFLFLTNLAWKNRVALPALIMVGCMVFNYRGEIEINIHTERIALHDLPHRQQQQQQQGGGGAAFGGIAIDDLEGASDEEYDVDENLWSEYDSEDDENEYYEYDDDEDDTYDEEDEDDEGEQGERMLNGTIRLNWYTTVNIHNARR
uniref:Uncharacterized protein n=1 Tax=Anopheles epiroticus TaxID=199890 RepID=A0A182P4S2_9DIPT